MPKGPVSNFTTTSLSGPAMDPNESGEVATTRFGNFEVLTNPEGGLHLLGGGGFGKTYKARHVYLNQVVALKVINDRLLHDASAKERFLREAQVVHQLRHPHIAHVLDFGEVKHSLYYAMEFCGGGTLEHMVSRVGPVSMPIALRCAKQLTEALGCAHSKGFIHRDVKPANVMLTGTDDLDPQLKLVDFGLVKHLQGGGSEATAALTATGQQFFTIQFASPEQLMEEELDPRSDIFALGMTIWFLLKGSAPEVGSMASIVAKRLDGRSYEAQLPAELPAAYRAVLARLLEKDRNLRFQNTDEVLAALAAAEAAPNVAPGGGRVAGGGAAGPGAEPGTDPGSAPAGSRSITELYTVLENLGTMPLGVLYRATSNGNDEQVAITMIDDALCADPAQRGGMERNVALLKSQPHETIARVYGLEEYQEGLALIQEWHRGVSLHSILKSARFISYSDALRVLLPIAQGTDWTMQQGLPGIVLAMDEIYLQPFDAEAYPEPEKLLETPLKNWPPFRVRLLPYVICEDATEDVGRTINTEIVTDPAVAFACLLYHLVAGHTPRAAARLSRSAYVTIGRFAEDSNRLLASCIANEQDFGGCEGILRALNANEGVNFTSWMTGQVKTESRLNRGLKTDTGSSRVGLPIVAKEAAKGVAGSRGGAVETRRNNQTAGGSLLIGRPTRDLVREAEELRAKKEAEEALLRKQQAEEERARKAAEEVRLRKQQAEEERARKEAADKLLRQKQAEEAQAKKQAEEERARKEAADKLLRQKQAEEAQAKKQAEEERARKEAAEALLRKQQADEERVRKEAADKLLRQKQAEEARAKQQAEEERARKAAEEVRLRKQQAEEERVRKEAADKLLKQKLADEARAKKQAEEERTRKEAADKLLRKQQAEAERAKKEAEEALLRKQQVDEERARKEAADKLLKQKQAEEAQAKKQAEEERARKAAEEVRLRKQQAEEERVRKEAADKLLRQKQAEEARAKQQAEEERARKEAADKLLRKQQAEEARAKKLAEETQAKKQAEEERARKAAADKLLKQKQAEAEQAKKLASQTLTQTAAVEAKRSGPGIATDQDEGQQQLSGLPPAAWLAAIAASVVLVAGIAFLVLHKPAPPKTKETQSKPVVVSTPAPTPVVVNPPKPTPPAMPTATPMPSQFVFTQGIVPAKASVMLNGKVVNPVTDGAKMVVPLDGVKIGDNLSVDARGYESQTFPITQSATIDAPVKLRRQEGIINFQYKDGTSDYARVAFKPIQPLFDERAFVVHMDPEELGCALSPGAKFSLPTGIYQITLMGKPSEPQIQGRVLETRFSVTAQGNSLMIPPSLAGRYPFEFVYKTDPKAAPEKVERTIVIDRGLQSGYADDDYHNGHPAMGTKVTDLTLNDKGVLHGFIRFMQRTDRNVGCDEQFELSYNEGHFVVVSGGWEIQPSEAEMARLVQKQPQFRGYKAHLSQPRSELVAKE